MTQSKLDTLSAEIEQYQCTIRSHQESIASHQSIVDMLTKQRDKLLVKHLQVTGEDMDLTLAQAALFMGVTEGRVRNILSGKKIHFTKVNGEHRISSANCRAYMAKAHSAVANTERYMQDVEIVNFAKKTGHNQLFTTAQASIYLDLAITVIHSATKQGTMKSVKLGRYTMIEKAWCDAYLELTKRNAA